MIILKCFLTLCTIVASIFTSSLWCLASLVIIWWD
jgi:hypothetical protein